MKKTYEGGRQICLVFWHALVNLEDSDLQQAKQTQYQSLSAKLALVITSIDWDKITQNETIFPLFNQEII